MLCAASRSYLYDVILVLIAIIPTSLSIEYDNNYDTEELVIIDADFSTDDCLALVYITTSPNIKPVAITNVFGNLGANVTGLNALRTANFLNLKIPVYYGAEKPIEPPFQETPEFTLYGEDGIGGASTKYPIGDYKYEENMKAHEAIVKLVNENPGKITIFAVGPLTNLALALQQDPTVLSKVKNLFVMGGNNAGRGNAYNDRPSAGEFNFAMDPKAAQMVLLGNKRVTIVYPWGTCKANGIPWYIYEDVINSNTKFGIFFKDYTLQGARAFKKLSDDGFQICDLLAAFVFVHDLKLITRLTIYNATVETKGIYTNGMMVLQDVRDIRDSNVATIDMIDRRLQNYYLENFLYNQNKQ